MIEQISTAVGVLKLVSDVIQVGKDIWDKLTLLNNWNHRPLRMALLIKLFLSEPLIFYINTR